MKVESFADGDVTAWIVEGTSIHLKTNDGYGDPVELTAEEARELAAGLLRLADDLDEGVA